jgi:hypothetical protein
MNEITNTTEVENVSPESMGLVEVLDANGNPTGQYKPAREGEAAPEETTFVAEDHADHVI